MLRISRQAAAPVLRVFSRSFTAVNLPCPTTRVLLNAETAVSTHAHVSHVRASPAYCCVALRAYSNGKEVDKAPDTQASKQASESSETTTTRSREPTNMERKIFVWTGKYKTVDEVPKMVSEAALMSAKSKFRIYINLMMAAATFLAALCMIYIGRERAKKGESVSGLNLRRHPEAYGHLATQDAAKK